MKFFWQKLRVRVERFSSLDWFVLAFGLVVFGLLAAYTLTKSGIWFDEAFSAYIVRFNFWDIAIYTATDVHPPLYYWVLKVWTMLFGTGEVAFRSLSVLFGMSAISAGFLLVRKFFGRRAAWVSLLFLVLSPMLIRYGQEARMYTMAATIALSATYVLSLATESKSKRHWAIYGVLVGLGMWTHYFTALVWLAHWAWRFVTKRQLGKRGKKLVAAFFSKDWMFAHYVAVGVYGLWLIPMLTQLATIQGSGFWIGPVSAGTFTNYFTNFLFYMEKEPTVGLYGTAFVAVMLLLAVFGIRLYRSLGRADRQKYLLVTFLAFMPVILLFLASTPPLASSFVERYLIPSYAATAMFAGITLTLGMIKLKVVWRVLAVGLVAGCMVFGVMNVYHFGNYNKNNSTKVMTREVVQAIQSQADPGEPIIVSTPWVFYEAVFYNTEANPIYFLEANVINDDVGSLDMLRNNDQFKIKDLDAFVKDKPKVWFMGYTDDPVISPPIESWKEIQNFSAYNSIDTKNQYKAAEFRIN